KVGATDETIFHQTIRAANSEECRMEGKPASPIDRCMSIWFLRCRGHNRETYVVGSGISGNRATSPALGQATCSSYQV
ncbi:MAG TPA: hypothetical protein VFP18_00235, partial [Candidatus Binatia bacterium]|nr:hypothetical protein [Candidatus Binatia bacterium]